jgi:hypothetical protein
VAGSAPSPPLPIPLPPSNTTSLLLREQQACRSPSPKAPQPLLPDEQAALAQVTRPLQLMRAAVWFLGRR